MNGQNNLQLVGLYNMTSCIITSLSNGVHEFQIISFKSPCTSFAMIYMSFGTTSILKDTNSLGFNTYSTFFT